MGYSHIFRQKKICSTLTVKWFHIGTAQQPQRLTSCFFFGGACHTFVSIEPILKDYSGEIKHMCDTFAQWVIVGSETGNRKGKIILRKSWIEAITETCIESNIALFTKDSLIPIVREDNMFREFPWNITNDRIGREHAWIDVYYSSHNGG